MIQFDQHIFQMGGSTTNDSQSACLSMFTVTTRNDSHPPQMCDSFFVHESECPFVSRECFSFATFDSAGLPALSANFCFCNCGGEVPGLTSQYQARWKKPRKQEGFGGCFFLGGSSWCCCWGDLVWDFLAGGEICCLLGMKNCEKQTGLFRAYSGS